MVKKIDMDVCRDVNEEEDPEDGKDVKKRLQRTTRTRSIITKISCSTKANCTSSYVWFHLDYIIFSLKEVAIGLILLKQAEPKMRAFFSDFIKIHCAYANNAPFPLAEIVNHTLTPQKGVVRLLVNSKEAFN